MNPCILTNISGFPELLPQAQIAFNRMMRVIQHHYEAAGAVPLETSAVERVEHLLAKGIDDKEIYALTRLRAETNRVKDYALHFDLTLPLARYVGQHAQHLQFPFKRYQMQPVWRGERAQNKRFRQFYQCDIDVIGDGTLALLYDAEIPVIIHRIFTELKIGDFTIHLNNRKILSGLLQHAGISDPQQTLQAIHIMDDLEKTGHDAVIQRLSALGMKTASMNQLIDVFKPGIITETALGSLKNMVKNALFQEGIAELQEVMAAIYAFGIPQKQAVMDLRIARGLDYYTGTVYETRLVHHPEIGSICSGGRYDDLTASFSRRKFPGVGISIGLSRLFAQLLDNGLWSIDAQSITKVLVTIVNRHYLADCLQLTADLRAHGINTEIYLESRKLQKQLSYAAKKGIPFALITGDDELTQGKVALKDLRNKTQELVAISELAKVLAERLACQDNALC